MVAETAPEERALSSAEHNSAWPGRFYLWEKSTVLVQWEKDLHRYLIEPVFAEASSWRPLPLKIWGVTRGAVPSLIAEAEIVDADRTRLFVNELECRLYDQIVVAIGARGKKGGEVLVTLSSVERSGKGIRNLGECPMQLVSYSSVDKDGNLVATNITLGPGEQYPVKERAWALVSPVADVEAVR